jgi:uncharacterized membrane protein
MSSPESIDELRRRIIHLESFVARFGFKPEADVPAVPEAAVAARTAIPVAEAAAEPIAEPMAMPPPMPPPLPKPRPTASVSLVERLTPAPIAAPRAIAQPVAYASPIPQAVRPTPDAHTGVEQAIGLKLAGWIGAIIVAIGAAMGVKFAYDQGWLGNVPPELKLGMLYAAALAVVGLGEWAYRKVDPRAAVGIYAAGIASLFVVGYAGSAYFHLYGEVPAFGLMAAACAIGAAISLRGGFVSIAVLSHLGANVAPFVLGDRATGEVSLLVYLLALQLMAVGLAHYGRKGRWWTLRTLALVTTAFWMTIRLAQPATAHSTASILFAALYALIFQLELILLVRRASSEAPGRSTFSAPTFSLAVTGFFVGALLAWTSVYPPMPRGAHLLGLAMILATAAAATLSSATSAAIRALATSWLTQAALLIFIAIPVSLDGPAVTFAWGGLAVAYAVLGFVLQRQRTVIAGGIVWIITGFHLWALVAISNSDDRLRATWLTIHGAGLPAYFAVALALGAAGHAISFFASSKRMNAAGSGFANLMAVLATVCWTVASLAALQPLHATFAVLVIGWVLVAIGLFSHRSIYTGLAAGLVTLALAKWAAIDVLVTRFDFGPGVETGRIVLNATMAIGAACAASLFVMLRLMRRATSEGGNPALAWTAVLLSVVALTVGLSVEVERAANLAVERGSPWPVQQLVMLGWTILWLAAVRVPVMVGRMIDPSVERLQIAQRVADVATMVLAVKFLIFDSITCRLAVERVAATPGLNVHVLVGLGVLVALWRSMGSKEDRSPLAPVIRALMFAVPLVVGSIELDRAFGPARTLIAWSVFWSVYAVASIVLGFWQKSAAFRFAGLGLLAATLLKIVFVDLAAAPTGWRIVSFLAVGAVLLLTSVIYGKLSPKLLAEPARP